MELNPDFERVLICIPASFAMMFLTGLTTYLILFSGFIFPAIFSVGAFLFGFISLYWFLWN